MIKRSLPIWLITTLILFLINTAQSHIIIKTKNGTEIPLDSVEILYVGGVGTQIGNLLTAEITNNSANAKSKIFVVRNPLAVDELILEAQDNGAIGALYVSPTYYVGGYLKWRWNDKMNLRKIVVPIFEMAIPEAKTFMPFFNQDKIESVTFLPSDEPNPWDANYASVGYYIWTVFLGVYPAVNIGLAIWKLRIFSMFYGGCTTSIAVFVLLIELISNALRLLHIIDPLCANFIYSEQVSVAFTRLSMPFALTSFILVILYWHEMMTSSSVIVHPFIVRMKIPFFVVSGTLVGIQLIQLFLRSWSNVDNLQFVTAVVYIATSLAIVIFHLITGVKLLRRMAESKNIGKTVALKKTTIKILVCAGFLVLFIVFAAMFATGFAYAPYNYMAVWYSLFTSINAASMANILAFELPQNKLSTKKSYRGSVSISSHTSGSLPTESSHDPSIV